MRTRLALALTACILATGCSSATDDPSSEPSSEPSATVTETVTATPTDTTDPTEATSPADTTSPTQTAPVEADPRLFPRAARLVDINEDVDLAPGLTARVEAPKSAVEGAEVATGDAELVVTVDGKELRAPIPEGPSPQLFGTLVDVEGGDQQAIVVLQSGGDAASYAPFTLIDGELAPMSVSPGKVELTSDTAGHTTWIGPDGALVTVVTRGPASRRGQVYRWVQSPQDLITLDAELVGERCFDWRKETVSQCG